MPGSKTTVSANPASLLYGQAVTVTAQAAPAPPAGFALPGGQVTFQDNGYPAGAATLSFGTATLTLNTLPVGTHQITAIYAGDQVWSSSFARVTVTVTLPALRITSTAADFSSSFAPDEAVSIFNVTVLNGDTPASAFPLPTSLGLPHRPVLHRQRLLIIGGNPGVASGHSSRQTGYGVPAAIEVNTSLPSFQLYMELEPFRLDTLSSR